MRGSYAPRAAVKSSSLISTSIREVAMSLLFSSASLIASLIVSTKGSVVSTPTRVNGGSGFFGAVYCAVAEEVRVSGTDTIAELFSSAAARAPAPGSFAFCAIETIALTRIIAAAAPVAFQDLIRLHMIRFSISKFEFVVTRQGSQPIQSVVG